MIPRHRNICKVFEIDLQARLTLVGKSLLHMNQSPTVLKKKKKNSTRYSLETGWRQNLIPEFEITILSKRVLAPEPQLLVRFASCCSINLKKKKVSGFKSDYKPLQGNRFCSIQYMGNFISVFELLRLNS